MEPDIPRRNAFRAGPSIPASAVWPTARLHRDVLEALAMPPEDIEASIRRDERPEDGVRPPAGAGSR